MTLLLSESDFSVSSVPRPLALSAPLLLARHPLLATQLVEVSNHSDTVLYLIFNEDLPSRLASADEPANDRVSGVRLDTLSISGSPEDTYTPPHSRQGHGMNFRSIVRRNPAASPTCVVSTNDGDDVFISPTKTLRERRSEHSINVANMERLDVALANSDGHPLRERPSNLNARHQINGVDAQNLYPPTACVFVAK